MANGNIPYDFLDYVRQRDPIASQYIGDNLERLYRYGKHSGYDSTFEGESGWSKVDTEREQRGHTSYGFSGIQSRREQSLNKITNPSFMNSLAAMADYGVDENSWAGWKMAYNNSLTGKLEQMLTGQQRYYPIKIQEEYEPGIVNDVLSGLASLSMPVDLLTFFAGGKLVGAPLSNIALKGMERRAAKTLGAMDLTVPQMGLLSSLGMAGTLATFEGAIGAVDAINKGEDFTGVVQGTVGGIFHGAALGAAAGLVGGGLAQTGTLSSSRAVKAATALPTQVAAEAGVFTAPEAYDLMKEGQLNADKLLGVYLTNVGMFGAMKGGAKIWGEAKATVQEYRRDVFDAKRKEHDMMDRVSEGVADNMREDSGRYPRKDGMSKDEQSKKDGINEENQSIKEERALELEKEGVDLDSLEAGIGAIELELNAVLKSTDAKSESTFIQNNKKTIITNLNAIYELNMRLAKKYKDSPRTQREADKALEKAVRVEEMLDLLNREVQRNKAKAVGGDVYNKAILDTFEMLFPENEVPRIKNAQGIETKDIDYRRMETWINESKRRHVEEGAGFEETMQALRDEMREIKEVIVGVDPVERFETTTQQITVEGVTENVPLSLDRQLGITTSEKITDSVTGLKRKKDVGDLIKESKMSEENKKRMYISIYEDRKTLKPTYAHIKEVVKLIEYFDAKYSGQKSITEMTKQDAIDWLKSEGYTKTKHENNQFKDALKAMGFFFGKLHPKADVGRILEGEGFAGKYMKYKGITSIRWPEVKKGKAVRITHEDADTINKTIEESFGEGEIDMNNLRKGMKYINEKGNEVNIPFFSKGLKLTKQFISDIHNFFYYMPKRAGEVLGKLKVEHWDPTTGELRVIHVEKGPVPFVDITIKRESKLFDILERNTSGKQSGEFIFGKQLKVSSSKDVKVFEKSLKTAEQNMNSLLKVLFNISGVSPIPLKGRGRAGIVYTSHNYRHSAMIDAQAIKRETGVNYVDFVDQVLLGHGLDKGATHHYREGELEYSDIPKVLIDFEKARAKITKTTEEDIKIANDTVERKDANRDAPIEETNIPQSKASKIDEVATGANVEKARNQIKEIMKMARQKRTVVYGGKRYTSKDPSKTLDATEKRFKEIDTLNEKEILELGAEYGDSATPLADMVKFLESKGLEATRELVKTYELQELVSQRLIDESLKLAIGNVEGTLRGVPKTSYQVMDKDVLSDYKKLGAAEKKTQLSWLAKKLPHLTIAFKKTLGTKNGERILGQITGHYIKITEGKAAVDSIPHEASHHVIDVLQAIGSPEAKRLIKDGIKKFKTEEKLVQAIGEYVQGRLANKGMVYRVKSWLKRFWGQIKNVVGGKDRERLRDEITIELGERVLRGDIDVSNPMYIETLRTSYQSIGESKSKWNMKIRNLEHKVSITEERKRKLREQAGWFPNERGSFKDTQKDINVRTLKQYYDLLSNDTGKGHPTKSSITDANMKYDISEQFQDFLYKEIGIKDLDTATDSQIKQYTSYIFKNFETPASEYVGTWEMRKNMQAHGIPNFKALRRTIMPSYDVLKKYGGDPGKYISNAISGVEVIQYTKYKGVGDDTSRRIKTLIGRTGANAMWVIDTQRSTPLYKNGMLNKAEKNFYDKMDQTGSREHEAKGILRDLMDFFWDGIFVEMRPWATKNQINQMKAEFQKQFVEDYFTRRVTPEFLKNTDADGYVMRQIVESKLRSSAVAKAIQEGYVQGKGKFEARVKFHMTDEGFKKQVKSDIWDMLQNGKIEMKNSFLEERGLLLKEYYTNPDTGRRIRTYETSFDNTVEAYINGMSKYLGVVHYLPEFTGIGHSLGFGVTKQKRVEMMEFGNKDMGWYAQAVLERELGLESSARDIIKRDTMRNVGALVNLNAMMGLSSPLSGLKNLWIQIPREIAVKGLFNTVRGYAQVFKPSAWEQARLKGQLEYGSKQLTREAGEQSGLMKSITKGVFTWNLMRFTENVNRIASAYAGKLYTEGLVGQLRGERRSFRTLMSKKQIRRFLDETLEMSDGDIRFLETTKLETPEQNAKWHELMAHAEHYSHVKSAGGTATGLLPLWASSGEGKPLVLFQKMAYVTTVDSYKNYVKPALEGNIMPLAKAAIGHGLTGYTLYTMYDYLFGTEPPKDHSGDFDIGMQYLWRGEFLGVLGEVISPHGGVFTEGRYQTLSPVSEPVVLRNIKNAGTNFYSWYSGGKNLEQATKDWLTQSVVLAGQLDRWSKTYDSKHFEMDKRLKVARDEFLIKMGLTTVGTFGAQSKRTPYYRDLKEAIYFKNKEELIKQTWKTYNFLIHEAVDTQASQKANIMYLHKEIIDNILQSAKSTSPLTKFSARDSENNLVVSKREEFLEHLRLGGKGYDKWAIEIDTHVQYKLREIEKILNDKKLRHRWSNYPVLSESVLGTKRYWHK